MPPAIRRSANEVVRLGRPSMKDGRQVNFPIELGSTVIFDTLAAFEAARESRYGTGTLYYGRYGSEASFALETLLAQMDEAHGVTLTSSGLSAITLTLTTFAKPGAQVLVADHVYGNTRTFCETALSRMGVEAVFFDPMIGGGIADLITDTTCAVLFEAPGSGTFEIPDIPAIAGAVRAKGVPSILDSTWATPVFCRPLSLGVDVVIASCSKYLSGHSDAMMGMIASSEAFHADIRKTVMMVGDKPGSQEVFLTLRGIRTLPVRMKAVDAAGRDIASWLNGQPQVKRLLHPAFESCPGHANWARDYSGAGGLFSVIFQPCADQQVRAFVDALHHFGIGVSWGGYESLVLPVTPIRTAVPWIEDGVLVRFNVGLEDTETLKADLASALPLLNSKSE